jgi:hypothetical protein
MQKFKFFFLYLSWIGGKIEERVYVRYHPAPQGRIVWTASARSADQNVVSTAAILNLQPCLYDYIKSLFSSVYIYNIWHGKNFSKFNYVLHAVKNLQNIEKKFRHS